ncbi:TetR/AcrR family transcriptional regulator [Variovorax boronicumulans]|uniref:TetR/AcrR family transcriptional regulator n=1 Tax=Variovorax boronicumulans TaxID=436515 RepID=UPI00085C155D|nr:TetR/AcrR family transcriptional regulator [Variovorax boronicumulans]OEZ32779.1 hypothetical protein AO062_00410 [Variovorax boronicumulans]
MVQQAKRSATTVGAILASARQLFIERGFAAVSIDDIAAGAGIAKGGLYHHFRAKHDVFEAVLDAVQAELAAELGTRIQRIEGHRSPHTIATNLRIYLEAATQEGLRQLILVDGPVVLGWERWRGIDDRHFMDSIRTGLVAIMPAGTPPEEIEAATRLIAGAVAEAALACGAAPDPMAAVQLHCRLLETMLCGLQQHGSGSPSD